MEALLLEDISVTTAFMMVSTKVVIIVFLYYFLYSRFTDYQYSLFCSRICWDIVKSLFYINNDYNSTHSNMDLARNLESNFSKSTFKTDK